MRVRHLQTHLQDQGLVYSGKLSELRGVHVGVDAVFWLRSIQALKDPFADALGGIPPGMFGFVDKELDAFKEAGITPLFVFQGVAPGPQHSMFVSRMDHQMDMAWNYLAQGEKSAAQKCFAVSTSRINGDFVYFIYHHLRNRGYECLQAPYFAGAQLAHFAEQGVVQTIFGPPGLLLYGVKSVVIHLNFSQQAFDWVDLGRVLDKWQLSWDEFVDACMLAGTEYCLTYPYLNLSTFQPQQQQAPRFNFDAAVYIIKQAPLINWMQTFPTDEMRTDHVEGYCICKVLVQNSPVLHLQDHAIRPLGACKPGGTPPAVPQDFSSIMGQKLPPRLYYLMLHGIISHKLPQALAKGEWTDKSQPLGSLNPSMLAALAALAAVVLLPLAFCCICPRKAAAAKKAKKKSSKAKGEDSPAPKEVKADPDEPILIKKQKKAKASSEELEERKAEAARRKERSKAQLEANKKAKPAGPPKTGAKKASAAVEATKKTGPKMTEEEAKALFDKAQQRNKQAAAPAVSASRGGRFAAFGDESD